MGISFGGVGGSGGNIPESWITATYATGWGSYNPSTSNVCQYLKDSMGFVCIRGTVRYTSGGTDVIFTLPAGYRPTKRNSFPTIADSLGEHVNVSADGTVELATGTGTNYVTLDGIRFDTR